MLPVLGGQQRPRPSQERALAPAEEVPPVQARPLRSAEGRVSGWVMYDFHCETCRTTAESLERRSENVAEKPCPCGGVAKRCLSAVMPGTVWGSFARGKSDERPPGVLDTRPLADGMPKAEWRKQQRAAQRDRRYRQVKELVG